ncbi:hypothetical protein C9J12_08145 [Photobacterium frigidiphilum]|uniref:Transposase n=1 Tax=Photobacterium frigidiphilum TaxID=264736 RepID=A0A2T3JKJ0_9GAMM|nr:Mu transposase C-terminal domain-containing protein [Photobacterium frigidiphilum]PSU49450.1 hypothetical protein C9J12_08145 [Photobacterium frigidiphilum]
MWLTAKECTGLPDMPTNVHNIRAKLDKLSSREIGLAAGESFRKRQGSKAFEYHIDCLPTKTQQYLREMQAKKEIAAAREKFSVLKQMKNAEEADSLSPDEKALAMNSITGARKARCLARAEVLSACDIYISKVEEGRTQATKDFVCLFNSKELELDEGTYAVLGGSISDASVRRWRKWYREGGLAALDSRKASNKGAFIIEVQPDMKEFAVAFIAEFPHAEGMKMRKAIMAQFSGTSLDIPSLTSTQRWLKRWKEENASLYMSIKNPDQWRSTYMAAFGCISDGINELNQLWELDATPADLLCTLPDGSERRYHLTGLIDVWSRRPMLMVTETPRTESNAALMRRAILEFGKPAGVKLDNGSDYVSRGMLCVLDALDITYDICTPFSPWEKPHIERFFRSFSHDLLELKPGFVGHNVSERKDIEARKSFADRLMKGKKKDKDREVIRVNMTPEELQVFCDDWVNSVYMHREHGSLNTSPFEKVNSYNGAIVRVENERALDQLLSVPTSGGIRSVSKKGIRIDGIHYSAPELSLYIGHQVQTRYDKDDLGRVILSELDGTFICIANSPEYEGLNRADVAAEAKRLQRSALSEAKKAINRSKRKYKTRDVADRIIDHAKEQVASVVAMPKRTEFFNNASLQGAADATQALENEGKSDIPQLTQKDFDILRDLHRESQKENETEETRFLRWLELNDKVEVGEQLDEVNTHWKKRYETTPEFKGRYMVWEDFGDSAFR